MQEKTATYTESLFTTLFSVLPVRYDIPPCKVFGSKYSELPKPSLQVTVSKMSVLHDVKVVGGLSGLMALATESKVKESPACTKINFLSRKFLVPQRPPSHSNPADASS